MPNADKPMRWNELQDQADWRAVARLDLRDAGAFAAGHLPGSVSIPVPSAAGPPELETHLPAFLLPPRHEGLLLVDDDLRRLQTAAAWLRDRDRGRIASLLLDVDGPGGPPSTDLESGPSRAHLWRPPPFLEAHLALLPAPDAGPVVDLGAGSGRAAVWLVERGYRVTAVDHLPDALDLARRLAADRGVDLATESRDLTRPGALPAAPNPSGRWSAALAFRFLDRGLLAALPDRLAPGGVAMVRTFRWDPTAEILPRRRHCLEPDELLDLFASPRWKVLLHVEDIDPDGRPAAGVVARLRG